MDRGKQGTKRSAFVDGIPLGTVVAPANRHDCPLPRPTLETLSRFGFDLLEKITVHLDAGYDSKGTRELLAEPGCHTGIATEGVPAAIQNTKRWVVERTKSWHNRGFQKLAICTEKRTRVIEACIGPANVSIDTDRILRQGWTRYRWLGRPTRRPQPTGKTSRLSTGSASRRSVRHRSRVRPRGRPSNGFTAFWNCWISPAKPGHYCPHAAQN